MCLSLREGSGERATSHIVSIYETHFSLSVTSQPQSDGGDPEESWPSIFSLRIFQDWGTFFRLGVPSALSVFVEWGSFEVTSTLAARLGAVALDTHTVFCQTVAIWYMPSLGLASAASTLVREKDAVCAWRGVGWSGGGSWGEMEGKSFN